MATVNININPTIKLPATDYYSEASKYPAPKQPEIWQIENNNGAVLVFPDKTIAWLSAASFNSLEKVEKIEVVEAITPPSSTIDSDTLLKAIAIAQNPSLAVNLLKD